MFDDFGSFNEDLDVTRQRCQRLSYLLADTALTTDRGHIVVQDLTVGAKLLTREAGFQSVTYISKPLFFRQIPFVSIPRGHHVGFKLDLDVTLPASSKLMREVCRGSGPIQDWIKARHVARAMPIATPQLLAHPVFLIGFDEPQTISINGVWIACDAVPTNSHPCSPYRARQAAHASGVSKSVTA